jgi:glutamine amidotransferase
MCRLLAYLGQPILLDKFLYEPQNSMITQSYDAKELEEPLNGDGFGIGWYAKNISIDPAVFVSIYPAWNNRNLRYLAGKIQTDCLIAHVRAASVGEVMESNCHPFHYGRSIMAHNGGVEDFHKIKRPLRELLNDQFYLWIKGQTDSEHLFALLLQNLHNLDKPNYTADDVADAFEGMIAIVKDLMHKNGVSEPAYLNMVYLDGERMVGLRYVTHPEEKPLTLYYSEGSRYVCEEGVCRMEPAVEGEKSVMIVSEKMTDIAEDWRMIPDNHMILVYKDLSVKLRKVIV